MRIAIIAAALIALPATAAAHSWYDGACCNENDCRPIENNEARKTANGFEVWLNDEWVLVPYGDKRIRSTPDVDPFDYHGCFVDEWVIGESGFSRPSGRMRIRCLYVKSELGF